MKDYYSVVDLDVHFAEKPEGLFEALSGKFSLNYGDALEREDDWVLCLQPLSYDSESVRQEHGLQICVHELADAIESLEGDAAKLFAKRTGMVFDFAFELAEFQGLYYKIDIDERTLLRIAGLNASVRTTLYLRPFHEASPLDGPLPAEDAGS